MLCAIFQVQETFSVERVYLLFRNLGLRHLVVVDEFNRVKGIITRKDLLGFKLDDAMARAIRKVDSVAELGRQDWTNGRVTGPTRQSSWSNAAAPAEDSSGPGSGAVLVPLPSGAV
jgi:CBS-domain-containing membrane protein